MYYTGKDDHSLFEPIARQERTFSKMSNLSNGKEKIWNNIGTFAILPNLFTNKDNRSHRFLATIACCEEA